MYPKKSSGQVGALSVLVQNASNILGCTIWIMCLLHIFQPAPSLRDATIALFLLYLLICVGQVKGWVWWVVAACSPVILSSLFLGAPLNSVRQGLDMSLVFFAFMPAISLIGWVLKRRSMLQDIGTDLQALPEKDRAESVLISAHFIGAVMTMGAVAVLALPFRDTQDQALRTKAAALALRGMVLAVFWTPFSIGMGFATSHLPQVPLWQVVPCGLLLGAIGLALSVVTQGLQGFTASCAMAAKIALPVALASAFLILGNYVIGLNGISIIAVAAPVLVFSYAAISLPNGLTEVARPILLELGNLGNEMTLYAASLVMGVTLSANPAFLELMSSINLTRLPLPLILYLLMLLAILGAMLGLHSSLICTVLLAISTGIGDAITPLTLLMLLLFGWISGAMLSLASISLVITKHSFSTSMLALLYGTNLRFLFIFSTLLAAIFACFHSLF